MSTDRFSNYGAGKVAGAIEERERIIKLLEAEYERGSYEMGIVPHLIALIKGENK